MGPDNPVATPDQQRICIVGAGQAGGELAIALRLQGCTSSIVLVGEEPYPPCQRPPLSKAYLKGEIETSSLHFRQQAAYERSNIDLILNARVECVDVQARTITLSDSREFSYSTLALTTGGRP